MFPKRKKNSMTLACSLVNMCINKHRKFFVEKWVWLEHHWVYLRPSAPFGPHPSAVTFWVNVQWSSEAELASEVYFLQRKKRGPAYQGPFRQVPSPTHSHSIVLLFYSPPSTPCRNGVK